MEDVTGEEEMVRGQKRQGGRDPRRVGIDKTSQAAPSRERPVAGGPGTVPAAPAAAAGTAAAVEQKRSSDRT